MEIARDVYSITKQFPPEEKFGLTSQIRGCAVSIPSNIAEGAARNSKKEFLISLYIALGSLSEPDTQLELATSLDFLDAPTYAQMDARLLEEDKILTRLIRSQKESI